MTLPSQDEIVLKKPYLIIQTADSGSPLDTPIKEGTVYRVYQTCDAYGVGDLIVYYSSKSIPITNEDDITLNYFLIREEDIISPYIPL